MYNIVNAQQQQQQKTPKTRTHTRTQKKKRSGRNGCELFIRVAAKNAADFCVRACVYVVVLVFALPTNPEARREKVLNPTDLWVFDPAKYAAP